MADERHVAQKDIRHTCRSAKGLDVAWNSVCDDLYDQYVAALTRPDGEGARKTFRLTLTEVEPG